MFSNCTNLLSFTCFVTLVPVKKKTLLKWRTAPPERDTVNENSVTSVVLNYTELCEDEKPIISIDSSKPNEIHEELSNDSKTETLSDFTITDQEIDTTSQEDATEDKEKTCEPAPKLACDIESASVVTEKSLLGNTIDSSTDTVTALPPQSPEPLVVDIDEHTSESHDVAGTSASHDPTNTSISSDPTSSQDSGSTLASHDPVGSFVSHEPVSTSGSHDATGKVSGEKAHPDQTSDVKSNSGTDTPQQGKRKKVWVWFIIGISQLCFE